MDFTRSRIFVVVAAIVLIAGGLFLFNGANFESATRFFTWEFWQTGKDGQVVSSRSEVVRNLGLLAVGIVGFLFAAWRTWIAQRQQQTAEEGLITERFTKAVEQMGSDNLAVRIGAIHALWRIAEDSPERDYVRVLSILCAFAREPNVKLYSSTQSSESNAEKDTEPMPSADVVAILQLLKNRPLRFKKIELNVISEKAPMSLQIPWSKFEIRLPFYKRYLIVGKGIIDLTGANLSGMELETIDLKQANLTGAILKNAKLEGANFSGARLERTDLCGADLSNCDLTYATLTQSKLNSASLFEADLSYAMFIDSSCVKTDFGYSKLRHTILRNTDVRGAEFDNANFNRTEISGMRICANAPPVNLTASQIDECWAFKHNPPIGLRQLGLPDVRFVEIPGSGTDIDKE